MKKEDQKLYIGLAAVAVAYFGIIRPILKKVGIQQSASEQQQAQQTQQVLTQSNVTNPFSPVFYKNAPAGARFFTVAYTTQLADRIYNALGYFYDDEAAVIAVFRLLPTQTAVSFLSDIFQKKYQTGLLDFLRKGKGVLPEAGLNDSELGEIIQIVKNLPKYK